MHPIFIGTSGYEYTHWRDGVFYPRGMPGRQRLPFYASRFSTVELNYPFYRLPPRERFVRWAEQTPGDFIFAVKAYRLISHYKKLLDCEAEVVRFVDAAEGLGRKFGVVLCQLPPGFGPNLPRLDDFLGILPPKPPWVIEFRHPGWLVNSVLRLLDRHGVGFCVPVGGRLEAEVIAATGPVGYVRFHRGRGTDGNFTGRELSRWGDEIEALAEERPVYVYFNNDQKGFAIRNAERLRTMLEFSESLR